MTNTNELKPEHFPNDTLVYYNYNWYKVVGRVVHDHKFILDVRKCFDDEGHDITVSGHTEHINCDKLAEDIVKTIVKHEMSRELPIPNYDKYSMYEKAKVWNIITHTMNTVSDEQERDTSDTYEKQLEKERSQLMLMIQNKIDSETHTVEQLTNLLGCNLTTLARITQGKPNYFTLDNLIIYARRLGIELVLTVF